jgi:queuine tRNA-ribosyltransferase
VSSLSQIETGHGRLKLPAFLPDATKGAVRTVDPGDLEEVGVEALCVSTWHLAREPGTRAIEKLGGVHAFMGFEGPVLSDSGGFQILSLIESGSIDGSTSAKGMRWKMDGGESELLTPEKCIRWQAKLGADLLVCLDHCTFPDAPPESQRASVEHTVAWAEECKATRDRIAEESRREPSSLPLLAVIQGGDDPALRRECAQRLLEIGFDGYAFGGWPAGDDGALRESVALVAELAPRDKPLWGLGIGRPENLVAAARAGYSLFDCVLPTRDARHGRLYVRTGGPAAPTNAEGSKWYEHLHVGDAKHAVDRSPLEAGCPCPTCSRHSRGYLRHLWQGRDPLALRLATLHNLSFYARLIAELRARAATAS